MEERFKNQHIRDKDVFKALAFYSMLKQPAVLIFHIVYTVICICGAILSPDWYLFIAVLVGYYVWITFRGIGYVKAGVKRDNEIATKGPFIHTMTFYDDKIVYENTIGASLDIDYSIIKKVASEKKYYFLITKQKQFFVLKKDSFVRGEEKDFLSFVKEKCNEAKKAK